MAIFPGTFHAGRIVFDDPQLMQKALVRRFGDGERVDVSVEPHEEKRSFDQNAYIHAEPIRKFCKWTGNTPAQQKLDLLGEYFGWTVLKSGAHVPVKASTSELTKKEMSDWIEWLIQFGAENGLNIMPPEPDPSKRDVRVEAA